MIQDTFFTKKPRRSGILKEEMAIFLMIAIFLIFAPKIWASTIIEDSFETCEIGILNGQCDWLGNTTTSAMATSTEHFEGSKSAYWDSLEVQSYRVGNSSATGTISFWFKIKNIGGGESVWLEVSETSGANTPSAMIRFTSLGLEYYNFAMGGYTLFCPSLSLDTWYETRIQWNASDDSIKYYCGKNGTWTGWLFNDGNYMKFFDTLGVIWLRGPVQTGQFKLYVDEFGEPAECDLNTCWWCGNQADCETAGCHWWYDFYTGGYCFQIYEYPEECGGFWKCNYCLTEETCLAIENCEWVNRYGIGEKCWLKEPIIPPTQAGWEAPELEDCNVLSQPEKSICLLKNFIAGIYLPSQSKINTLYNTFEAMKLKFPFNYVQAINVFFTDIKDSLNDEKSISFKIFGQASEVVFTFWNSSSTIGGTTETLGNIVKDFTSFIIILGFFVWLIHFIRRFAIL